MTFRDGGSKLYLFCYALDEHFLAFITARDLFSHATSTMDFKKKCIFPSVLEESSLKVSKIALLAEKV